MVKVADKAKLGPSTARKSVAGTYAKKPVVNSKHKKRGISYAHQSKHRDESNVQLKRMKQPCFLEIARMTHKKAEAFLEAHQVLAQKDETFHCWQCGAVMVLDGQKVDVLRCSSPHKECHRPRLHDPRHAYTPFASEGSAGWDVQDYSLLLRVAYALGCKLPMDATVHMVRDHDEHIVAAEKRVGRYMRRMRLALAYAEIKNAKSTTFRSEITEMDSGRMGSKKESNSNPRMKEHQGRTLVLKRRVSKKWVAFALRTTMSKKGRGMGTEKIDEVRAPLRDSLGAGTVIAADGAKTWQSIAKEIKKPILRGISHQKKIFCNVDRMKKRDLSKAEARTMTTAASSSSAQEGVNHFWAAAGDNAAEGLLGHIKGSMRRQNLVGRGAPQNDQTKLIQSLSSAMLLRCPGIGTVLDALAVFRKDAVSGLNKIKPKDAFSPQEVAWLYKD